MKKDIFKKEINEYVHGIRNILVLNFQDTNKPVVFLESLIHAREWITLPATLYAIEKLVIDVQEQDLLRDIDWIILPIANPDGYEVTHQSVRFDTVFHIDQNFLRIKKKIKRRKKK